MKPGEVEALVALRQRSIAELGPRAYSPRQVEVWLRRAKSPEARRIGDGRLVLVAVDAADRPLGFSDLEADGHVDHLFLDPRAIGRGLGAALVAAIQAEAMERGIGTLVTEASLLARPVFAKAGFRMSRENVFAIDGVEIGNTTMEWRAPTARVR